MTQYLAPRYNCFVPSKKLVPLKPQPKPDGVQASLAASQETILALASFRYALRGFLRFSEDVSLQCGVTPQQHQLMLGVAGHGSNNTATISQLAEFLQEKHHSVIGLVDRAVRNGLVIRHQDTNDRRVVVITLTPHGATLLVKLTELHAGQAQKIATILTSIADGSNQQIR
ncbi:MAG: MarR family winged helix-turn-helix transcriptional regulator [Bryocella sp.]